MHKKQQIYLWTIIGSVLIIGVLGFVLWKFKDKIKGSVNTKFGNSSTSFKTAESEPET